MKTSLTRTHSKKLSAVIFLTIFTTLNFSTPTYAIEKDVDIAKLYSYRCDPLEWTLDLVNQSRNCQALNKLTAQNVFHIYLSRAKDIFTSIAFDPAEKMLVELITALAIAQIKNVGQSIVRSNIEVKILNTKMDSTPRIYFGDYGRLPARHSDLKKKGHAGAIPFEITGVDFTRDRHFQISIWSADYRERYSVEFDVRSSLQFKVSETEIKTTMSDAFTGRVKQIQFELMPKMEVLPIGTFKKKKPAYLPIMARLFDPAKSKVIEKTRIRDLTLISLVVENIQKDNFKKIVTLAD